MKHKDRLKVYDKLRSIHAKHKSLLWDHYQDLDDIEKNALDAVHSVLYLAEGVFSK